MLSQHPVDTVQFPSKSLRGSYMEVSLPLKVQHTQILVCLFLLGHLQIKHQFTYECEDFNLCLKPQIRLANLQWLGTHLDSSTMMFEQS
jgi:hypothetical protein